MITQFNKKNMRRCIKKPFVHSCSVVCAQMCSVLSWVLPVFKRNYICLNGSYVLYCMLHAFVSCICCIVVYKLGVTSFQQSLHQIRAAIESGLPSLQQFSELRHFSLRTHFSAPVLQKLDIDMSG